MKSTPFLFLSFRVILFLGGILQIAGGLRAQGDTLFLRTYEDEIDLKPYITAWIDSTQQARLGDVQQLAPEAFLPIDSVKMPLPLGLDFWGRIVVVNLLNRDYDALYNINNSDSTILYVVSKDSLTAYKGGALVEVQDRDAPYGWENIIRINLPQGDTLQLYSYVHEKRVSGANVRPYMEAYEVHALSRLENSVFPLAVVALFVGTLLITCIYNLIVGVSMRSRAYIYYSLYILFLVLTFYVIVIDNIMPIISIVSVKWHDFIQIIGLNGSSIFYLLFGRSFVQTRQKTPKWDYVLQGLIGLRILFTVAAFFETFDLRFPLGDITDLMLLFFVAEAVLMLIFMVRLAFLRSRIIWFFIIGSALVFLGGFMPIWLSSIFGIFQDNGLGLIIALSLEIVVFSLGLGYKVRQQQREKLEAEQSLNQELQKVNSAFGRFVPHAFLESLGHTSVLDVQLGDQVEKDVTVLFSDIRGYTSLAEGMTPKENFSFLNAYLGRMGPIIQKNGGFVNQYYGDGIMALFMGKPEDAIQAGVQMQRELARYNETRMERGRTPIRIGIGLHTGPLMMGIIGDTLRLEAGVVSDTVNTAARMEGLTKHFGVNLLISEATIEGLGKEDAYAIRQLGKVQVKGRKGPLDVYQVFDGEHESYQETLLGISADFKQAMELYFQGDFAEALSLWEDLEKHLPNDKTIIHYRELSHRYLGEGTPDEWNGVEVMYMK